jgi:cytochrome c oxidase subunit 2
MRKTSYIIISLLMLVVMEGAAWAIFKSSQEGPPVPKMTAQEVGVESKPQEEPRQAEPRAGETPAPQPSSSALPTGMGGDSGGSFPPPTTEVVKGRTERTIHMGVRRWEWDPAAITVKQGELVRLIIHNADVLHGLVIPDLGVNQDVPPDGAVVEFIANKIGTFEFFCSVWCGEGHMEMRGMIVIQ